MKLKPQEQAARRPRSKRRLGKRPLLIAAALLAMAAWTSLAFIGGIAFLDFVRPSLQSLTGVTSPSDAVRSVTGAPTRWMRAWLAYEEVPRLYFDIKYKNLHKLHQKRDEAMALGLLQASGDDFVPAQIRVGGGQAVRVKIRLKGDYIDHLEGEKWSLRVHVKKDQQLFGMRRFSIQAPRTRAFQAEPIVLDHYRREGVLAPRYFFVEVSINGKDIGLMAVEESFSKELLESSRRREGVIVRFHEDPFFANKMRNGVHGPFENFYVAEITPFGSSRIAKSPTLSAQLEVATGMLRGFLDKELTASEVFDVEQTTRFMAVSEVWGAVHALRWHNLRFYLNPITLRLEPIAFDINMQATYIGTGLVNLSERFPALWLEDPTLRAAFVRSLRRIAEEMRDGATTAWVQTLEAPMLAVLNREFPLRAAMQMQRLERRAGILASISEENFDLFQPELVQPEAEYPEAIHAYLQRDTAGDYLEFINVMPVPVIVHSLFYPSDDDEGSRSLVFPARDPLPVILPATALDERPSPTKIRFEAPDLDDEQEAGEALRVEGTYQVLGQRRHHSFEAQPYFATADHHPIDTATLEEALEEHLFLRWDEAAGHLQAAPGDWLVAGSLVLPAGVGLELGPGTTLRFEEHEALIASGPLIFLGGPDSPVVLQGTDADSLWSGIVVLRSDEAHDWKNVIVRNTAGISRGGWLLTGGVTLRDARVHIEDSLFESNHCEDALNIVRSEFELTNVRFVDTLSDAFDGDFVSGRIVGGSYEDVGGDGIDVSGAEVSIENVRFKRIHDKALSMGEGSRAQISGVRVEDAGTAVASKDASRTEVSDSEFYRIRYTAIMAYMKKSEYGPAQLIARDVVLREVGREAIAQLGSQLTLNGVEVAPETVDIDAWYEHGYMRK